MKGRKRVEVIKIESNEALQKAFAIRKVVFVEEQKVSLEEEFDEFEQVSIHFLAKIENTPVGAARWRKTDKGYKLERFAVLKEHRGQGVGSALVEAVLNHINTSVASPQGKRYLHAQMEAVPLYAKFGFVAEGEQFMECDILHQTMVS